MKKQTLIAFSGLKFFLSKCYINLLISSLSNINIYDFGIICAFFRFILKICWMIQYMFQEITSNPSGE